MIVNKKMSLNALADLMGPDATIDDADNMRYELLLAGWLGQDTANIPNEEWDMILNLAYNPES